LGIAAICFFIVCTSICALVSAITLSGMSISPVFYPFLVIHELFFIWTVSTAVADLTITISMIAILYHAKSSAYFGETRDRISHLLHLTLQTGFLTSIFAIPIAPLYSNWTHGYSAETIYDLLIHPLSGSYVIALLANLNARSYQPTSPDHARRIDDITIPHVSSLRFTAVQPQNRDSNGERPTRTGIISLVLSVVHTIHRDLTETTHERTSRMEREAHLTNFEEQVPGNGHDNL